MIDFEFVKMSGEWNGWQVNAGSAEALRVLRTIAPLVHGTMNGEAMMLEADVDVDAIGGVLEDAGYRTSI